MFWDFKPVRHPVPIMKVNTSQINPDTINTVRRVPVRYVTVFEHRWTVNVLRGSYAFKLLKAHFAFLHSDFQRTFYKLGTVATNIETR